MASPIDVHAMIMATAGGPIPGDIDSDGDVDLNDWIAVSKCAAGPDVTVPPIGCDLSLYAIADIDADNDVDLNDLSEFSLAFTGP